MRLAAVVATLLAGCSLGTLRANAPMASAIACMSADVATTAIGREAYGIREANPLVENYAVLVGSKVGAVVLIYGVNRWITPVSPWTWYGVAGMNCAVAGYNVSLMANR